MLTGSRLSRSIPIKPAASLFGQSHGFVTRNIDSTVEVVVVLVVVIRLYKTLFGVRLTGC